MKITRLVLFVMTSSVSIAGTLATAQTVQSKGDSQHQLRRADAQVQEHSSRQGRSERKPIEQTAWQFGDPLSGLDAASLAAFEIGLEEFESVEDLEGGLGPIFNNTSCVACHSAGATGGASDEKVTRFGRVVNGVFDGFDDAGGSLLQAQAIDPLVLELVPPEATIVVQRLATPLYGAGLIEAIPDETIRTNARRRKPHGVAGRVSEIVDVTTGEIRVGRFGWKAQQATLLAFSAEAYRNELGVTNRFFPVESAPNGRVDLVDLYDQVPDIEDETDPETGLSDSDHLANFARFLAPPPPLRKSASALAGSKLFEQVGCSGCHTPIMHTGPDPVAALSGQAVALFSDLLLHDMGELADGIAQDGSQQQEMRTAPLWGLRVRTSFLHDGRAGTITEAIVAHAGEATGARQKFSNLDPTERQQLLDFLASN